MSAYGCKRIATLARIAAAIACAVPAHALAQAGGPAYPAKPVRIVLGFSAINRAATWGTTCMAPARAGASSCLGTGSGV